MQAAEQPQWRVPRQVADEGGDARVVGQAAAEVGVERRAPRALLRLPAEDLCLLAQRALD